MTLGEKIRQVRLERGLTQKQLAGDRITRNQLSQIENDLAQPSMRTLEYLAAGLGVDAGWLMTQEDGDAAQTRLTEARDLFREGRWAECMERTGTLTGEEALLMRSICARRLAEQALDDERFSEAGAGMQCTLSLSGAFTPDRGGGHFRPMRGSREKRRRRDI